MFLKPTAKPVPRRTPSPRVVLPAPPGRRVGSRGRASGSGTGMSAQLHRVELERRGELVHLRLGGEARLHGSEAAHRAAGRVVRVDAGRVDQRVGDGVGAAGEGGGVRTDGGRARRVGAAVQEDAGADADELAVAVCAVLHPDARGVPMDVADERLLAVVDELDRTAGVEGEHGAVNLHGEVLPPTEGATDAGEVDPHLLLRKGEAGGDLVAIDMEPLRGDVDVDAALPVGDGEAGLDIYVATQGLHVARDQVAPCL